MTDPVALLDELAEKWRDILHGGYSGACLRELERCASELEAAIALMRAPVGDSWNPIGTAPDDRIHVRGLWVTMKRPGRPDEYEWRQYVGYIEDESGRFVDPEYSEDFGWQAHDFDRWMDLPAAPERAMAAMQQTTKEGGE